MSARNGRERVIPLDGPWKVALPDGDSRMIEVPNSLEDGLQMQFDGISIWERELAPVTVEADERLLLCFDAVATRARVWFQGEPVGEHLGGWTPFECDVTDVARRSTGDGPWRLRVEVDELVGHNTQGFLPVVTHHFGGIWQAVRMEVRGPARIDQRLALVRGSGDGWLSLGIPVIDHRPERGAMEAVVEIRRWPRKAGNGGETGEEADGAWQAVGVLKGTGPEEGEPGMPARHVLAGRLAVPNAARWSLADPALHEVRIRIRPADGAAEDRPLDEAVFRCGFATMTAMGPRLLLNGDPVVVRGVLNWGYAPPRIAPSLDEAWMRNEIRMARERGFNLMKFCLWIPPRRYLELCDELGMLAWVEYPTWHPHLDGQHEADLIREYGEFFAFDRNHPSVVLRSLTCETGPSADIEVIRRLYGLGKRMVPGALIEDDSSWIQWNRIHDFYDDHPYGNNHDWRETLRRLKDFIAARESMPLVLGEAIAADVWTTDDPWKSATPFLQSAHRLWSADACRDWTERMQRLASREGRMLHGASLELDSFHYALTMREFQIDTFREMCPDAGYVVSVIRDFPRASMGLIGADGEDRFPRGAWQFHGDRMLLLERPGDRFAVAMEEQAEFAVRLAGWREPFPESAALEVVLSDDQGRTLAESRIPMGLLTPLEPGGHPGARFTLPIPGGEDPRVWKRMILKIRTRGLPDNAERAWTIWGVPGASWPAGGVAAARGLPGQNPEDQLPGVDEISPDDPLEKLWIVRALSDAVLERLERGGKVLLLPDGGPGSFPLENHWFLRGGPAWFSGKESEHGETSFAAAQGAMTNALPLVLLQHFDLAGPVIPSIDAWIGRTNPRLVLWDNHDLRECRTHGLWFEMPVGARGGCLTVSALNHFGEGNVAGQWWLRAIARQAAQRDGFGDELRGLAAANLELLQRNLHRRTMPLATEAWEFRPDPQGQGLVQGWPGGRARQGEDSAWSPIRIGQHWEHQGFPALDGWGWYRVRVQVPEDWPAGSGHLEFEGVDDCARVFVNGEEAGRLGNDDPRESAFDLRESLDVGRWVSPGGTLELVFAVYDWQGAGGLFRPVTLTTGPLAGRLDIVLPLKQK